MRRPALWLCLSVSTFGCAPQDPPALRQAQPVEPPKIEAKITPDALPAVPIVRKPVVDDQVVDAKPGLEAIKAAREKALIESAPDGFINAVQFFFYEEGALYELHGAPGYVTTIQLQPGEEIASYVAGDTARWEFDYLPGRAGVGTQLFVKPRSANLSTNLIITTDQRVYLIEAQSHRQNAYNSAIAWRYPGEQLATEIEAIERENERRSEVVIAGVPIDQLNFDYEITGDTPPWRPTRAFDDGQKVYIEFPDALATSEAPPLFITDDNGENQLVNFRVKNRYYVVDRLFSLAELRLNDTAVQIAPKTSSHSRWSNGWIKPRADTEYPSNDDDDDDQRDYADAKDKW